MQFIASAQNSHPVACANRCEICCNFHLATSATCKLFRMEVIFCYEVAEGHAFLLTKESTAKYLVIFTRNKQELDSFQLAAENIGLSEFEWTF